ncbi:hypothetical protein N7522_005636 [Penicillium canescens]|uniref:Uncharacterized protein n=1 Tax=Penicillium canescens TaxID=5083 RepID=A0AAD6IG55_PENCN|nr:uncharacterized protein N7446_011741 [Penicillium canescens]KAJ6003991.1 hypothetical protein N7522_005636 [Penicillium canescens]KAJ6028919.1 hypothetical protein N7444_011906 [Penicillium canescens]KAJ6047353.1 hypothetical protein N7460_003500 [Penicillium canescens]KAJ6049058.1 hypothetical protein N7446_011741 [Penicillium canescens]
MPEDNYGNSYTYNNSGQNSQGNHFCVRDFGPDYSNQDGSYYYSNPDGSTYHNDGQGNSTYTPPAEPSQSEKSGK